MFDEGAIFRPRRENWANKCLETIKYVAANLTA